MAKLVLFVLSIFIITSCGSNNQTSVNAETNDILKLDSTKRVETAAPDDRLLTLGVFTNMPDTIGGCGEYLTYDTSEYAAGNYIFLSNLSEFAIININGNSVYLLKDKAESKTINDKSYVAVYKGNGYKAVLKLVQTKAYDEGGFYAGTLQISKGQFRSTYKVHGEAGC